MKKKREFKIFHLLAALLILVPVPSFGQQVPPGHSSKETGPNDGGSRYRADELLVKFSRGAGKGAKEDSIRRRGFKKIKEFPFLDLYHVKIRPHQTVEEAEDDPCGRRGADGHGDRDGSRNRCIGVVLPGRDRGSVVAGPRVERGQQRPRGEHAAAGTGRLTRQSPAGAAGNRMARDG